MTPLVFRSGNFGSGRGVCKTSMKRIAFLLALQVFVLPLAAAEAPKECALCAGAVSDLQVAPAAPVPLLVMTSEDDFAKLGPALDAMPPAARAKMTFIFRYSVDDEKDPMSQVEKHTKAIVDWAGQHGPFEAVGVKVSTVDNVDPKVAGYGIKRLAVVAQGQNVASRIVVRTSPSALAWLDTAGALPYVDIFITDATDVKSTAAWVLEKDPAKKIWAIVTPQSPNVFFDLSRALADGATRAYANAPATA